MKLSPEDLELWDFDLTLSAFKPVLRNGTTSVGRVVSCYSIDLNELKRGSLTCSTSIEKLCFWLGITFRYVFVFAGCSFDEKFCFVFEWIAFLTLTLS